MGASGGTRGWVGTNRYSSGNNNNSCNADGMMLGTPPRLPQPLADGMIVGAATEAARWLAVDDRTWHQVNNNTMVVFGGGWV